MAYSAVPLVATGDLWTAASQNTYLRDNFAAHEGTIGNLGIVQLPVGSAILPISAITPMALTQIESTAASPKVNGRIAQADAAADEWLQWEFMVPRFYDSGPILWVFYYMDSAAAGNVVFASRVACMSDGDAGMPAKAYAAVNTSTTAVPGVAGTLDKAVVTLTNDDSMAASDICNIGLYRDADSGSDTATGDAIIKYAFFVFTAG